MPFISVVMPAYKAEKTIGQAIDSVLAQTFKDLELIVVNDCSPDDTRKVMEEKAMLDERVRCFDNDKNRGASYTRNYAVKEARGEWIAFLDSDDMWTPDKLEKQLALKEKYDDGVIFYTASSFIDDNGEPYDYVMPALERIDYKTLLKKNLLSCSSVLIRSDVMKAIEMPGDSMHEDYYVWLKVLGEHKYAYGVNEPLLIYRLCSNSKSSSRIKSAKMLFNAYRAVGYGRVSSFLMSVRYSVHSITKRHNIKSKK